MYSFSLLTASERDTVQRRSALIAAIVSAACFGTLAIFASFAYDTGAEPLPLLAWRFGFAATALAAYTSVRRPGALRVPAGDVVRFVSIGVLGYGAASVCFFHALQYADASIVAVLLYTYPAMVVLAERVVVGTSLTPQRLSGVALTFIGCALVLGLLSGGGVSLPGIVLGVGAGACYTVFSILSQRWLPGRSKLVMMTYMLGANTVSIGVLTLATGGSLSPAGWSAWSWFHVAALALIPTVFAVVLYFRAIEHLGVGQAAIVSTVEPVFTIMLACLFLGERLGSVQLMGVALVIAGVFIAERGAGMTVTAPSV